MSLIAQRPIAYRLPMRTPWRSAAGVVTERRGWLVRLEDDRGRIGWGDCGPMPEIGTETWEAASRLLPGVLADLNGREPEDATRRVPDDAPAVRCALETALCDLSARTSGHPLARGMNPSATDNVPVNAACGSLDAGVIGRCLTAVRAGFRVLKLKMGLADPSEELARLLEVTAVLPPQVRLRLDANRAWDPRQALLVVDALAGAPVESLEEPLRDPTPDALARLQTRAAFPLALDESLVGFELDGLLRSPPVCRLVLKPMACGGPIRALRIARQAQTAGIQCVITSSLESAVGVTAALHLAAALDNGLTHGLATSAWLTRDVAPPLPIERGRMAVPNVPGLGIEPEPR